MEVIKNLIHKILNTFDKKKKQCNLVINVLKKKYIKLSVEDKV